ncbi:MAG: EMC3/TMCO1 family protein [Nanoarchaeota archaeon]
MVFLDPVFNPVFQPLLNYSPLLTLLALSFIISLLITLVYKYFTNQDEMKRLKEQQKEFQKKMKDLRSNPNEMMKVQKEAMKANLEYMKHSFKSTLITLIPIIIIFSWMNAHLAYEPIYPEETYSVTALFREGAAGEAELVADEGTELLSAAKQEINGAVRGDLTWDLKSTAGEHILSVKAGKEKQVKNVLITKKMEYAEPFAEFQHSDIQRITINYNKLKPFGSSFSLFGWYPGWLAAYIVFSIAFSLGLRKIMNVY